MRRLALIATLLAACAAPAFAANTDFTLVNRTGYPIDEVYVGASSSDSWGSDIMGKGTLNDGQKVDIIFTGGSSTCSFDLMVKYSDASTATWKAVNLCNIGTVTLYWDANNQVSRAVTE